MDLKEVAARAIKCVINLVFSQLSRFPSLTLETVFRHETLVEISTQSYPIMKNECHLSANFIKIPVAIPVRIIDLHHYVAKKKSVFRVQTELLSCTF